MIVLATQMKNKRLFMWRCAAWGSSSLSSRYLWLRFG